MAQKLSQSSALICLNIISIALLISHSSAEDVIESKDARSCSLNNSKLSSPKTLNFTQIIEPQETILTIPDIHDLETKTNRTLRISLCSGMTKKLIRCEGLDSSQASACLYDSNAPNLMKLDNTTSNIVGKINLTHFYYDVRSKQQPQVYWLARYNSDTCDETKPMESPRVKISFDCLKDGENIAKAPTFVGHNNCTYNFKWAVSKKLCPWLKPIKDVKIISGPTNSTSASSSTQSPQKQNETDKNNTATKQETLTKSNTTIVPPEEAAPQDPKTIGDKKVTLTPATTMAGKKIRSTTSKPNQVSQPDDSTKPKMNTWHRVFMTGLIIVSLVGFIVGLLILDKKTQLRIPLGNLAGRGRLNRRSVPYNRMGDSLGSGLDL